MGISITLTDHDFIEVDGKQYVPQSWLADVRKPYADKIVELEKERDELNTINSELNESHKELINDYRVVRESREILSRRVNDLQNTKEPMLNDAEWEALRLAERPLYTPFMGYHAFTDVMERQDGQLAAAIWGQVEMAIEMEHEKWETLTSDQQRRHIAQRVARALAMISFGPEFLLR